MVLRFVAALSLTFFLAQHATAAIELYQKLGFQEVDQGVVFRKDG